MFSILLATMIATATMAQGVIDVHSHIITPEFVSALETERRLMDEGFPLPKYDLDNHLRWMDEAGVETPHFQKYKQGTLHMVKDLKLPTMKPLDPETMKLIFKKQR